MGTIEQLYVRQQDKPQTAPRRVQVVRGQGIEGDRYFGAQDEPGQNITFIEAEAIEQFQQAHGRAADLSISHRNVVTRGVSLNELVGRTFRAGGVQFRGVELCEPCLGLGQRLSSDTLLPPAVVKAWVHRGGLRADALSTGALAVGDRIEVEVAP